jgi:hypothetical protein
VQVHEDRHILLQCYWLTKQTDCKICRNDCPFLVNFVLKKSDANMVGDA